MPKRKERTRAERAPARAALPDRLMSRDDIADLLGVTVRQIYRLEEMGLLPPAVPIGLRRKGHWKSTVMRCMGHPSHPTLGSQGSHPSQGTHPPA